MDIERTLRHREDAKLLTPLTWEPNLGIKASVDGRYSVFFAGRDFPDSVTQSFPFPSNLTEIPGLLEVAKKGIQSLNFYRGKKTNNRTGEEKDLPPHEVWTEDADQSRLFELYQGGMPVKYNKKTGRYSMVNYFAADAPSKTNQAMAIVADSIELLEGPDSADQFRQQVWPEMLKGLECDFKRSNGCQYGLPIVNPKNKSNFWQQTRRDGFGAYTDDQGQTPQGPYIFFSNACNFAQSLEFCALTAQKLGQTKISSDLLIKAEQARDSIDRAFWSDKLGTFAPLIDKNGQVQFINSDPIEGLYQGVLSPSRAAQVVDRLLQPDLLTPFGVRSRSVLSPGYSLEEFIGYQNGAIWPDDNTRLFLGLVKYGYLNEAFIVKVGIDNYIENGGGFSELKLYLEDEKRLVPYMEKGVDVAPSGQSWFIYGYLGVSAWVLNRFNTIQSSQLLRQESLSLSAA